MVAISTQLALEVSVTCAAGFLMIVSGLQKRLLERPTFGICPTCGRRLHRRRCDVCSNRST
jgi:hypothetical protein